MREVLRNRLNIPHHLSLDRSSQPGGVKPELDDMAAGPTKTEALASVYQIPCAGGKSEV